MLALEVLIAGLAVSVMANYAGNITRPPLEAGEERHLETEYVGQGESLNSLSGK